MKILHQNHPLVSASSYMDMNCFGPVHVVSSLLRVGSVAVDGFGWLRIVSGGFGWFVVLVVTIALCLSILPHCF